MATYRTADYSEYTAGPFSSSLAESESEEDDQDYPDLHVANVSDCEASISFMSVTTTGRRLQIEDDPMYESSHSPCANHGSCPSSCKKRLVHAVLHCCPDDTDLAYEVKMELEKITILYLRKEFPVRVMLLSDVTNKTVIESLTEIRQNDMTKIIILLCTEKYRGKEGSHNIGLKIINTASNSSASFDVIELFTDKRLMEENKSDMVQSVLYEPKSSAFKTKMRTILMGRFDNEQVQHDRVRRDCEKKRCRDLDLQRQCHSEKNNKRRGCPAKLGPSRAAGKVNESTAESDSSVATQPNKPGSVSSRDADTHNRSSSSNKSGPCGIRHPFEQPNTTTGQSPLIFSTDSSSSEGPPNRKSEVSSKQTLQANQPGDQSESCSSSVGKDFKGNKKIKSGRIPEKQELNLESYPEHIPNDTTIAHEPREGCCQARIKTDGQSDPKVKQRVVETPVRQNHQDSEDSDEKQTLRKTMYTDNTTSEVSVSTSTSDSSETAQQDGDTTPPSAGVRPQQNNAMDPQTLAFSEPNAEHASDEHQNEDLESREGELATPTQLPVSGIQGMDYPEAPHGREDSGENSRRRQRRSLPSRFLSRLSRLRRVLVRPFRRTSYNFHHDKPEK